MPPGLAGKRERLPVLVWKKYEHDRLLLAKIPPASSLAVARCRFARKGRRADSAGLQVPYRGNSSHAGHDSAASSAAEPPDTARVPRLARSLRRTVGFQVTRNHSILHSLRHCADQFIPSTTERTFPSDQARTLSPQGKTGLRQSPDPRDNALVRVSAKTSTLTLVTTRL